MSDRDSKTWNTSGIDGVHRFLARSWRLVVGSASPTGSYLDGTVTVDEKPSIEQLRSLHRCIDKVVLLLIGYDWHVTFGIEFGWDVNALPIITHQLLICELFYYNR